jgi:hypothetical protein
MATANFVIYSKDDGVILSYDQHFAIKESQMSADKDYFQSGPQYDVPKKVLITSESIPQNISELSDKTFVDTTDLVGNTVSAAEFGTKRTTRNAYENGYFQLVKAVLTLANDPRKNTAPIPKLSFDELDAILDTLYETPATEKRATKLAMKLLSVNAALQRFNVQWWNTAKEH